MSEATVPEAATVSEAPCVRPAISWPEANCAAPRLSAKAEAAKIPFDIRGMMRPPLDPSPHGDRRLNAGETPGFSGPPIT
jgi:hypothetical protein